MNRVDSCRVCGEKLSSFMSYGKMPIANGFIKDKTEKEDFFNLDPGFCEHCYTFQILEQPDPEMMFHEEYAFFTRQSKFMQMHFKEYAEWVNSNYLTDSVDPFVVEIGSNDGAMLENFAKKNIRHLGIDPSKNVVESAKKHGVNSIVRFFNLETADEVLKTHGKANAILAANVMCHIPNLNEIAESAFNLLTDDGVLIFEDPYLGEMIEKVSYDQIYDEHVYIFSAISCENIFGRHGFELINLLHQSTHGGSMRFVFGKKGARTKLKIVDDIKQHELSIGLDKMKTYLDFKQNCEDSKRVFRDKLIGFQDSGKRVAGYGATSKSTTILNYCDVNSELIEFISDTTPIKQNKFSPGKHIPIKSYEYFLSNIPEVIVLFAWNHAKEIIEKEQKNLSSSIEWITHLKNFKI